MPAGTVRVRPEGAQSWPLRQYRCRVRGHPARLLLRLHARAVDWLAQLAEVEFKPSPRSGDVLLTRFVISKISTTVYDHCLVRHF